MKNNIPPKPFEQDSVNLNDIVLYTDEMLLVANKPASIPVVPDGYDTGALCLKGILEAEFGRIWVVHRIDRPTSGVLLFARSESTHRDLND